MAYTLFPTIHHESDIQLNLFGLLYLRNIFFINSSQKRHTLILVAAEDWSTSDDDTIIFFFWLTTSFQQFIMRAIYSFIFWHSMSHKSIFHHFIIKWTHIVFWLLVRTDQHQRIIQFFWLNPVFQQFIVRAIYSVTLLPLYVFQSIFLQFITKETCSVWFNCLGIKLSFI